MFTTFSLWQDFQSKVNTSQNGWFRPETDFERAINEISIQLWNDKTKKAEKSQQNTDDLAPFIKSKNLIVQAASNHYGLLAYPKDYGRYFSSRIIVVNDECLPCQSIDNGKCDNGDFKFQEQITDEYYDSICETTVIKIDNQRWGAVCEHLTKAPTLKNPMITQFDGGFKVAPRKVSVMVLDYFVKPKPATFKYTVAPGNVQTGAGDQIIYDTTSQPLEWPEAVKPEFLEELKNWYIQFTRDQLFSNITTQLKSTGA